VLTLDLLCYSTDEQLSQGSVAVLFLISRFISGSKKTGLQINLLDPLDKLISIILLNEVEINKHSPLIMAWVKNGIW